MLGHVDKEDLASIMGEHDEDPQHLKRERRDDEEVDGDELADVIRQEGAPGQPAGSRRWRPA